MKISVARFLRAYACCAVVFPALDAAWLTTMADRLYRPALGAWMRADFDVAAAAAFYLLYITGVVAFAVAPERADARWTWAGARGALFGLVAYATYDLTNQATLRSWPWHVTVADLCWGTFATAVASAAAAAVVRRVVDAGEGRGA